MRSAAVCLFLIACGGDDGPRDAAHQMCIDETNSYREEAGKPPLVYSTELEAYADEGAMVDFSSSPHEHFSSTNGGGIAFAENECPQQGNWTIRTDQAVTVRACIAAFFSEGPGGGHYQNMMGPYGTIGCGIYQSGNKVTIVQDLGQ
jgi:hypothetical protein